MAVGDVMSKMDKEYFSVVFRITDKDAFEPERRRLCNGMRTNGSIPGAKVTALSLGSYASYESYSEYLNAYIDERINSSLYPQLTFAEWLENGAPKKHDEEKEYLYLENE